MERSLRSDRTIQTCQGSVMIKKYIVQRRVIGCAGIPYSYFLRIHKNGTHVWSYNSWIATRFFSEEEALSNICPFDLLKYEHAVMKVK